ncbi:MAG: hypothetical protein COA79_07790 [Planctomycetota bacterium]|nr:MAG: hypothetical protein COA79_07790 [Planctomycetota bacterium]
MKLKTWMLCTVICFLFFGACKEKPIEVVLSPQEQFIKDNPKLSEELKKTIMSKTVKIGMTESQVKASWGEPKDIKVFSSEFGSYKYWSYDEKKPKIYWKDGKVDKIRK